MIILIFVLCDDVISRYCFSNDHFGIITTSNNFSKSIHHPSKNPILIVIISLLIAIVG